LLPPLLLLVSLHPWLLPPPVLLLMLPRLLRAQPQHQGLVWVQAPAL
jgi:hypothetical protein